MKNAHISHNKSESFKHDYSRFKEDTFLDDFNRLDFTYLKKSDLDVNNKFDRFLKELNTSTNKHTSIKRRSRKQMKLKDKPWINNRTPKMTRILHRLKKQHTSDNLKLYKKFRNRVSNELKESKARYFHD